ncbi:MAG: hypothetical protein K2N61_01560 [Lachnospiraceae bacterium]|nr:hypothetical protein [Lachnospiraceae bacterium]
MKNNQILPFERNRYYSGKMLSSSDFLIEQTYQNNKRRFINQMMFGSGIVCGLGVYNLDDLSLMVESGAAIDAGGREIVVDNTVIKKLSAIKGYDELETNEASLCIRYAEEPVHNVYVPSKEGNENEFNHVDELFELYLTDKEKLDTGFLLESEFLLKGELVHTEDYILEMSVPAVVCMGKWFKILFILTKHSQNPTEFLYRTILQMPLFLTVDGKHEAEIHLEDNCLERGESTVLEIWVQAQNLPSEEAKIIIKPDSAKASLNRKEIQTEANFFLTLVVADINPRELVDRELGKTSLEMRIMTEQQDFVKLADIVFQRTESGGVIQSIEEKKAKKYIEVPSDGAVRNEYLGYYAMYTPAEKKETNIQPKNSVENIDKSIICNGGYFEIPLGKGAKKGEIFYSGEIIHSLGTGDVYVEIGYENREKDALINGEISTVVYGSSGIFSGKDKNETPVIECAVKILKDKGSFIGGVRFLKNYDKMVLRCRWSAIQISTGSGNSGFEAGSSIAPEKPTIQLAPGDTCFFPVKFINMEPCRLCYELSETGSGVISEDGVYTAPDKEGVFEIHIFCVGNPFICTYAYALVKAKQGV